MKKHAFGALCALSTAVVQAETDTLEPVVVTATRSATPIDRIPASVTMISREDIAQAQANDVGELLRGVTGIDLGRNGGPGQATSIFMRGTESDHTLVLIDGVVMNSATSGGAAIQNIDPRLVERIEIVRGPLSSLYGSSAIGGVINIITRRDTPAGSSSHFSTQVGNNNSFSLNAGTRMAKGPFDLALNLSHQTTDGYPTRDGDNFDSGFRNDSLDASFGYRMGTHDLRLQAFAAKGNTGYSSFGFPAYVPADQDFENSVLKAGLTSQLARTWISQLTLSRMVDKIDQNQSSDFAYTTRYAVDWQHSYTGLQKHHLIGGATLTREKTEYAVSGGFYNFDTTRYYREFYLQDHYTNNGHDITAAARLTNHSVFGSHPTWNLGYGKQLSAATRLRASIGSAFRAPNGIDYFGDFGGHPDLKPETSKSAEIGINHRLSKTSSIDAGAYHTRINDMIAYDPVAMRSENIASSRISGVELRYDYKRQPWLLSTSAEWKDPRNHSDDTQLLRRSRVAAKTSLMYSQARWDLALSAQYTGKRPDIDANTYQRITDPAYTLVNATGRWYVDRHTTLEGRLENLLDKQYQVVDGYNAPGRGIYLGVRVVSD